MYAFLDNGYLYMMAPNNNMEIKNAVITGVFKDPDEVDGNGDGSPDENTDLPLTDEMWSNISDMVFNILVSRPAEDPINNSEPDYATQPNRSREKESQ